MSEGPQRWLSELYRASSREEPPVQLDSLILSEAGKASRTPASIAMAWGVPLAAAAVVVLTVTLVITVRDEFASLHSPTNLHEKAQESDAGVVVSKGGGEPAQMARQDQHLQLSAAGRQAQGDAQRAEDVAKTEGEAPAGPVRDKSQAAASPPARNAERSERSASAALTLPASPAPALETREQTPAQAEGAPPPAAKALGKLASPGGVMEPRQGRPAAESDPVVSEEKQRFMGSEAPRRLESALDDRMAPDAWLERIAKLRAEGRQAEARESLAAFKKRYPDHPVPDALKSL